MKDLKKYLKHVYWILLISGALSLLVLYGIFNKRCNDKLLFRNEKFVIVETATSGGVSGDKFHKPIYVKSWLIQRIEDTTMFAELSSYSYTNPLDFHITNELWYNKEKGDTIFFKHIKKDRFFIIKKD